MTAKPEVPRSKTSSAVRLFGAGALALTGLVVVATPSEASRPGDAHRFDTWVGYDIGRFATVAAAGDFNGDGVPDVAWGRNDFFDNTLSVTLNLGDGTLGAPDRYPISESTQAVEVSDLDSDSDLDLVIVGGDISDPNETIDVLLNDGNGTFAQSEVKAGVGPEALAIADLDGDGVPDLVVPNSNEYNPDDPDASSVSVLLGNGDGTFAAEHRYRTGYGPEDADVADVDGDGTLDIITERNDFVSNRYSFEVLHGKGDGTFVPDASPQLIDIPTNGGVKKGSFELADLDDDGDIDAFANGFASFKNAVLKNDGTGTFTTTLYEIFGTFGPRIADLDRDDDLDVVSTDLIGAVYVQRNNGDGTFAAPETLASSNEPYGVDVADVDQDHRLDLLIANRGSGIGSVHLQQADGTFAAPVGGGAFSPAVDLASGDLDGDGDIDVAATGVENFVDVVQILLNNGSGNLTEVGTVDSHNTDGRSINAGDIDGDADIDLAWLVNEASGQRVLTAANNGDGTFAKPVAHDMPTCSDKVTLADADGDGAPDLIVGNDTDSCIADATKISIAFNNGDGTFGTPVLVTLVQNARSVVVADVDGDGETDLIGGGVPGSGTGDIGVAYGAGDRTYPRHSYTATDLTQVELVTADFDGDGDADVAANSFDQGTAVLINDGTGDFSFTVLPGEQIAGYRNTVGIAVGDVNGDTIPDLLIANETGSNIGLHAGNGDGTFEPLQVRYGMRPRVTDVKVADLDGDGVLDILSTAQVPPHGDGSTTGASKKPGGVTVLLSKPPKCTIKGTSGDDNLKGTRKADVICGLGGNDTLRGLGSGDILIGGDGNDTLIGGNGADVIDAGDGNDKATGGADIDRMRGGAGTDTLTGGAGADVLDGLDHKRGNDTVNGGKASDHCRADKQDTVKTC